MFIKIYTMIACGKGIINILMLQAICIQFLLGAPREKSNR